MPCYSPLHGFRSRDVNPSGKRSIVFTPSQGYRDLPVTLPCGQCIGCRLEHSRQWAIRCVHEAQLHQSNEFITLTYNDENLPKDNSLDKTDFQKFMKRLRKKYTKVKYFHCGEYGEKNDRPHYHACLFNIRFADRKKWKIVNDETYYQSDILDKLWGKGHTMTATVTFESAAYVARYVTKKITGDKALHHYNEINTQTGEITAERRPEYATMSNGLAKEWLAKYTDDVYPEDFVVVRGKKMKPPKYYNHKYELANPDEFAKIKAKRIFNGKQNAANNTYDRLAVREYIQKDKFKQLKRGYENE